MVRRSKQHEEKGFGATSYTATPESVPLDTTTELHCQEGTSHRKRGQRLKGGDMPQNLKSGLS